MTTEETEEIGSVFISNYPPFSTWDTESVAAVEEALDSPPNPDTRLGLYLHIPFCRKRCHFCYFRVYTDKDSGQIARYVEALAAEVALFTERAALAGRPLDFVYFGGGTPSYLSAKQLHNLVGRLRAAVSWDQAREFTFECEPGTLSASKLQAIREIGVSRLSLGIESFDDKILKANGRAHLSQEIERVRPWIEAQDFPQLNVDLIAGMIGETWESWRESVRRTIDYGPDSVTIYQLELPWNATFSRQILDGEELHVASWAERRDWHEWAIDAMEKAGFEVSSAYTMVKKGAGVEFAYRNSVWDGCDLIGTGVASFSHVSGVHFQNLDSWGTYLASVEEGKLPLQRAFATSADDRLRREVMLQLKLGQISPARFQEKFDVDILDVFADQFRALESEQMASVGDDEVRLTPRGLLQVDSLLPRFYHADHRDARYT